MPACNCRLMSTWWSKDRPVSTTPGCTSSATRSVPRVSRAPSHSHLCLLYLCFPFASRHLSRTEPVTGTGSCTLPGPCTDERRCLRVGAGTRSRPGGQHDVCAGTQTVATGFAAVSPIQFNYQTAYYTSNPLFPCCSTSFTTAGYGSHQNVFIRLDPLGRPPSATGSYATIASLNKYPTETKKSCSIFDRKSPNSFALPAQSILSNWLQTTLSMLFAGFRSSPTPTPYATALLPMGDQAGETIYSKPESVCPSRISYYASSQLTQVSLAFAHLSLISMAPQGGWVGVGPDWLDPSPR